MRHSGVWFFHVMLAAAGLAIMPVPGLAPLTVAMAESVAPVTNYEVFIRMLGKKFPATAENIRKKFEKIDKSDGTPEQKHKARHAVLSKEYDKLKETEGIELSKEGEEALKEAQVILQAMKSLHTSGDLNATALPKHLSTESGTQWRENYQTTRAELEEQRKREAELEKQDGGIAPEHSSAGQWESDSGWSFALGGGIGERKAKNQTYLATDIGGSFNLGVVKQDRDVTVASGDVAIRYAGEFSGFTTRRDECDCEDCDECDERYPHVRGLIFEAFAGGSHGSDNEHIDDFDGPSGAGTFLGIPGTGDTSSMFPAGIALSGLGNTDVTDIHSRYEFDSYQVGLRIGQEFDWAPKSSITPFLGASYVYTSERQNFEASVLGFGLDFEYDTHIKMDVFKVDLGTRFEYNLSNSFSVFGEPAISVNLICVKGWDSLDLSGLVNDSQRVDLDKKETKPGVRFAVGFDWEPEDTPFSLYVGARAAYEPDSATVKRTGQTGDQTKVDVRYSESYAVTASISYKF